MQIGHAGHKGQECGNCDGTNAGIHFLCLDGAKQCNKEEHDDDHSGCADSGPDDQVFGIGKAGRKLNKATVVILYDLGFLGEVCLRAEHRDVVAAVGCAVAVAAVDIAGGLGIKGLVDHGGAGDVQDAGILNRDGVCAVLRGDGAGFYDHIAGLKDQGGGVYACQLTGSLSRGVNDRNGTLGLDQGGVSGKGVTVEVEGVGALDIKAGICFNICHQLNGGVFFDRGTGQRFDQGLGFKKRLAAFVYNGGNYVFGAFSADGKDHCAAKRKDQTYGEKACKKFSFHQAYSPNLNLLTVSRSNNAVCEHVIYFEMVTN